MKIAVMQPYVFPYIGYIQLINAVDTFVFYDNVNFIKGGWVHRNKILINKKGNLFAIPLKKQSSFNEIRYTQINNDIYSVWSTKFLKTIEQTYGKAPYFKEVYPIIREEFSNNYKVISELAVSTVIAVLRYLSIKKNIIISSEKFENMETLERSQKLLKMAEILNSNKYINAIGGKDLYSKKYFNKNGIALNFLKSNPIVYKQFSNDFIPNLSIIDVLMFNSKEEVLKMLENYSLV